MKNTCLDSTGIVSFREWLVREEKSGATVDKYLRDAGAFMAFAEDAPITKELVLSYKDDVIRRGYAVRSVNSMLAGVNCLLDFLELGHCRVKSLRLQHRSYAPARRELSKAEYLRLVQAAQRQGDERLALLLQTICATGIRVSELEFITAEAVRQGTVEIRLKGKVRTVLLPGKLRQSLKQYLRREKRKTGPVFATRTGKPLDRSNIWKMLKNLSREAKVDEIKVFPHNLRHLFARCFYELDKDMAKLADILGHSSINTTRIYIMSTGEEHRRQLDALGLVV